MTLSKIKFKLILILALVCWFAGGSNFVEAGYRGPFEGRVVDKETLEPIQGAVVFVEWKKEKLTPVHPVQEFYDAAEVLTDEKGKFYIPKKWSWNPWTNLMVYADVIIFKAGYGAVETSWVSIREAVSILRGLSIEDREKTEVRCRGLSGDEEFILECPSVSKYLGKGSEIRLDQNLEPLFLLKKLETKEERRKNIPSRGSETVPRNKKQLLLKEVNKERKLLGYREVYRLDEEKI